MNGRTSRPSRWRPTKRPSRLPGFRRPHRSTRPWAGCTSVSNLERYNDARDSYLKAVQVDSTYAPAFRDLGDLFRRARQYDRAERAYLRFLDLVPGDVPVLLSLAETDLELSKSDGALEAAGKALAADSSSTRARSIVIRAGLRSPDKEERIEAARRFAAFPDTVGWTSADWTALAAGQTAAGDDAAAEASLRQL
ncbi:MAG: hypothetical protein FD129_2869, partial [bacterium]